MAIHPTEAGDQWVFSPVLYKILFWSTVTDPDGVKLVTLYYTEPGNSTYKTISMTKDLFTNVWSASIGSFQGKSGLLQYYIYAEDLAGYLSITSLYSFNVRKWDITSPEIAVPPSYSPSPPTDRDSILIWSTVTDDLSGIKSVILNYTLPGESTYQTKVMSKDIITNVWSGSIGPFRNQTGLVWYSIIAEDNWENVHVTTLYSFTVSIWDTSAPIISTPVYSPNSPTDINSIIIQATITDDKSGLKTVTLYYTKPNEGTFNSLNMQKDLFSDVWSGSIGPFNHKAGFLTYYIVAEDNYGNLIQSANCSFIVGLWDKNVPTIDNTTTSSVISPVTPFDLDTITFVSYRIVDDRSGLSYVTLHYTKPNGTIFYHQNMTPYLFTEQFTTSIGPFVNTSGYITYYYTATDNYGNTAISNTHTFYVEFYDKTPPQNPTTWSSSSHEIGVESIDGTITITFSGATDDRSGVYGYSINVSNSPEAVPLINQGFNCVTVLHSEGDITYTTEALESGIYWIAIVAVDNKGNWAQSGVYPFQVTNVFRIGPFKINSEPDYGIFDTIGQGLIESSIKAIETEFRVPFLSLLAGHYSVNKDIAFTTFLGANILLGVDISVDVSGNIIRLSLSPGISGNVKIDKLFGQLSALESLLSKITILGVTPLITGSFSLDIVVEYNLNTRFFSVVRYGASISLGIRFTYDYIRLFIMTYAPTLVPLYDAADFIANYLLGTHLKDLANGYVELKFGVGVTFDNIKNIRLGELTVGIEAAGLDMNIDSDEESEVNLAFDLTGLLTTNSTAIGTFATGDITFAFEVNFDLDNIDNTALLVVFGALNVLGINVFKKGLRIDIVKLHYGPVVLLRKAEFQDTDLDGLSDFEELNGVYGVITNPNTTDTDSDFLSDYDEIFKYGTDPTVLDTDDDGLSDYCEVTGAASEGIFTVYFNPTDPTNNDTDGDWLTDYEEAFGRIWNYETNSWIYGAMAPTDPNKVDTDGDNFTDSQEVRWYHSDPVNYLSVPLDSDNDGLYDTDEEFIGTSPTASDTDGDQLTDYEELYMYGTDPTTVDTDNDGLPDQYEIQQGLNPFNNTDGLMDFDGDGLTNLEEYQYNCDPRNNDTDSDSLSDSYEVFTSLTNPVSADSDMDGLSDGYEIINSLSDPLNTDSDADGLSDSYEVLTSHTNPLHSDTDADGLPDAWEVNNGLRPLYAGDADEDLDRDGLSNILEFQYGTNPADSDTDNDALSDGEEISYNTNPFNADSDGDGLTDGIEVYTHGTNPSDPDTDGDGMNDGYEVQNGYNPLSSEETGSVPAFELFFVLFTLMGLCLPYWGCKKQLKGE